MPGAHASTTWVLIIPFTGASGRIMGEVAR